MDRLDRVIHAHSYRSGRMNEIELAAGFLPRNGSKAQGIGYQEERAATLRVADMGVLIKRKNGGTAYTLNSRDYKGVMIVVISKAETNSQDRNRPSDGISRRMG